MSVFSITSNMKLEPKRTHLFTFVFDSIPGTNESNEKLQLNLISVSKRPSWSYTVRTINRFNMKYNVLDRPNWGEFGELVISFHDNINSNLAKIFWAWNKNIFNVESGLMGYAATYKTDGSLYIFDPRGTVIEKWDYYGICPSKIEYEGEFNYGEGGGGGGGELTIKLTLAYDYVKPDETYWDAKIYSDVQTYINTYKNINNANSFTAPATDIILPVTSTSPTKSGSSTSTSK